MTISKFVKLWHFPSKYLADADEIPASFSEGKEKEQRKRELLLKDLVLAILT